MNQVLLIQEEMAVIRPPEELIPGEGLFPDHNQLLLVDVYRARYLLRQMSEREAFHTTLSHVLETTVTDPELNLANVVAKQEATALLAQEKDLF